MIIYGHGELFMFINWTKAVDVFCYTWLLCYFIHLVVLWLLGHSNAPGSFTKMCTVLTFNAWWGKEETWETSPKKYEHSWSVWINKTTYPPGLLNQWIKQWMITQTHISPIGIKLFSCILLFDFIPKEKHSSPFPASNVRLILFHPAKTVLNCHLMHQDLGLLFLQQRPGVSVKMGDAVGCTHFPMFPKESKTGIVSPNNKDEQMNIKNKKQYIDI